MNTRALAGILLLVLVAAGVGWWWLRGGARLEPGAIDLVERFPEAEKRTTRPSLAEGFAIEEVTIDGDHKHSILAIPFSRIIWHLDVPPGAVLRTAAGFRPDAWEADGDGGGFRVGVSDGKEYKEFFKRRLVPNVQPADRHWFPIEVDLTPWAGRRVDIIFNTDPGPADNAIHDALMWGAPRVVPGVKR